MTSKVHQEYRYRFSAIVYMARALHPSHGFRDGDVPVISAYRHTACHRPA